MLSSSRPYLMRAIYEWLVDNQLTPHLIVNAEVKGVGVPTEFVNDGQIILNVVPRAVRDFKISNKEITFSARFSGVARHITLPIQAVEALYAAENGRGMVFEDDDELLDNFDFIDDAEDDEGRGGKKSGRASHLRVIK